MYQPLQKLQWSDVRDEIAALDTKFASVVDAADKSGQVSIKVGSVG